MFSVIIKKQKIMSKLNYLIEQKQTTVKYLKCKISLENHDNIGNWWINSHPSLDALSSIDRIEIWMNKLSS